MSQETANEKKITENLSDNPGFRTALYLNLGEENQDPKLKEVTETLEFLRLNSTDFSQTPNMTPRQSDTYKDYISADLLRRLEESSPVKYRKSEEYMRRLSEMYLSNYEGEDASNLSKRESSSNIEDVQNILSKDLELKKDQEGKVLNNLASYATRNFKLKKHVMGNNEEELQEYAEIGPSKLKPILTRNPQNKEEPKSLFTNTMNFSTANNIQQLQQQQQHQQPVTNFSPTYTTKQQKIARRDSSPIYTYYDATAECLSQTFYDEFKKSSNDQFMSKNNFIKKSESIVLQEESNSESMLSEGSNKYSKTEEPSPQYGLNFNIFNKNSKGNVGNLGTYGNGMSHNKNYTMNLTQGYENHGDLRDNIGIGLGPSGSGNAMNYMRNQHGPNHQGSQLNHGHNKKDFQIQQHLQRMDGANFQINQHNRMDFSDVNSVNSDGVPYNSGQVYGHLRDGSTPMKSYQGQGTNKYSNKMEGSPINSIAGNPFQACVSNSISHSMDPEEYTVEMFGRKGWICEMCNNFNYETRQKCNRCGIVKTPKRIKKPGKNESSELDDSTERKKKKPFVERVGDWVCIKCKNLNFSFRVVCNRCQLPKAESDKMFESYMGNLMNYVKINEMMQQRIIQNNQYSPPGYVNNNSININNNYYGNTSQGTHLQGKNMPMNRHGVPFSGNGANFYNSGLGMSNFGNVSNSGSVGGIPFQLGNVEEDGDYYNDEN